MSRKSVNASVDFKLFLASDATFGTLDSIFEMTADVPAKGQERILWFNALAGLASSGRKAAREMNLFLYEAGDTHRFPATWQELAPDDDEDDAAAENRGGHRASR